jgi:hypothetical protein
MIWIFAILILYVLEKIYIAVKDRRIADSFEDEV